MQLGEGEADWGSCSSEGGEDGKTLECCVMKKENNLGSELAIPSTDITI